MEKTPAAGGISYEAAKIGGVSFDMLTKTWVAYANKLGVQATTKDGRLIGPFNAFLLHPERGSPRSQFVSRGPRPGLTRNPCSTRREAALWGGVRESPKQPVPSRQILRYRNLGAKSFEHFARRRPRLRVMRLEPKVTTQLGA